MRKIALLLVATVALLTPTSLISRVRPEQKVPIQNEDVDFVIVGRLVRDGEGSLYRWDRIEVIQILKAPKGMTLPRELEVAVHYDAPPISTKPTKLRLVRYNKNRRDLWKVASDR